MKHLKRYKIFENATSIIDNVNDMLFELNDEGFKCRVSEGLTPDLLPPVIINNVPMGYKLVKTHDVILVNFSQDKPGFDFDDIKEVYWRIKSYLEDNGYIEDGDSLQDRLKDKEEENKKIMGAGKLLSVVSSFTKPI